jgi:arsenate reductase (glutaredoxin)
MSIIVYGIPTCSTCTKAIKWLQQEGISHSFINTRTNPPSKTSIEQWVKTIGAKVMKNTSGGSYRALGDEKKSWSDAQWVEAFAKDPMLLKRPLFTQNEQALCTGFRDNAKELLKSSQ